MPVKNYKSMDVHICVTILIVSHFTHQLLFVIENRGNVYIIYICTWFNIGYPFQIRNNHH